MADEYTKVDCKDYASKGVAGTALGLGIAGTYGLLSAMGNNGNGFLGFGGRDQHVSQVEFKLSQELAEQKSKNAILEAGLNTNQKIIETTHYVDTVAEKLYGSLDGKIEKVSTRLENQLDIMNNKVERFRHDQSEINSAMSAVNATQTCTINCLRGQIDQLMGMTRTVIPNTNVCPGWGDVCVSAKPCEGAKGGGGGK